MGDNYQLFRRTTPDWVRLAVASVCAVVMMAVNGPPLVHQFLSYVFVTPVQRTVHWARTWMADKVVHSYHIETLAHQNQDLVAQNQAYAIRLQALSKDETENQSLRAQLGLKNTTAYPIVSAQVLYQVLDPYVRKLVLDAGSNNGVQLGQPVVAADGLVGQITDVQANNSEVTLITDTKVNVPVKVQRNPSVRGFISGDKNEGFLELRIFNQENTDLLKDDLLVTSGLDGLYPANIPVAKVTDIAPANAEGRSAITIVPMMHLMALRYVGVLQIANIEQMKARSDAQAEAARDNPVPSTLGARTREQYTKN